MAAPLREESLYARPEFTGFSLWAAPETAAGGELADAIAEFARKLGGPTFPPHMTVLAGIRGIGREEAVSKTEQLARLLRPLDATIEVVSSKEGLYFQCVFGLLSLTNDIAQANESARAVFGIDLLDVFMPHISLVYGDLDPEAKAAAVQELRPRFDATRISLPKLQLWSTQGTVAQWEMVAEFDLNRE